MTSAPVVSRRCTLAKVPDVLSGRYRIERLLGAGGMGAVYRARDLLQELMGEPDPFVAIKVLSDDLADASDASQLLYNEFVLTRRLHHPNVIRAYTFDVDRASGRAFMTLELMRGLSLDRLLLERAEGLPWLELRGIAVALLEALSHAHERGVLHGDLKPGNVMLTEQGVRLFDFGLGHAIDGAPIGLPRLNRQRLLAWTPRYAAPEIREGGGPTRQADIYSVGLLLYVLAAGKDAFPAARSTGVSQGCRAMTLKKPPHLPFACWSLMRAALAPEASARQVSAGQLLEVFRTASPGWVGGLFQRK